MISALLFLATYTAMPGSFAHINPPTAPAGFQIFGDEWTLELEPGSHAMVAGNLPGLEFEFAFNNWNPFPVGESSQNFFNPENGEFSTPEASGFAMLEGELVTTRIPFPLWGKLQPDGFLRVFGESVGSGYEVILEGKFSYQRESVPEPASALLLALVPFCIRKFSRL